MTKRPAITPAMRLAVLKAHKASVMCSECGRDVPLSEVQIDHHLALIFGGEHTVENMRPLCPDPCHRAKSAREHIAQRKSVRLQKKHSQPTPEGKIKSRPFQGSRKFDGTPVWRDTK